MRDYIKHLVECSCTLPQFKNSKTFVFHKFVTLSEILEDGSIETSYSQCNNCDAIHRVTEVGVSNQLAKETMSSLPKINEIATCIPEKITKILEAYKCDITIWQEVKFILINQKWGRPVILSREEDSGNIVGKFLLILGEDLFKVDNFKGSDNE